MSDADHAALKAAYRSAQLIFNYTRQPNIRAHARAIGIGIEKLLGPQGPVAAEFWGVKLK